MWGLAKASTLLLASQHQYSPASIQTVTKDFRELFHTLGEKAPVYKKASPTVKFSFVTPPPSPDKDWRDEDVLFSDKSLMNNTNDNPNATDNLFVRVANKYGRDKPIALYLPGLDGYGISAATWQFNDLSTTFELWRMSISVNDRSSFGDMVRAVSDFCDEISASTHRPVYVIAESFGGLLAPAVALKFQKRQQRAEAKAAIAASDDNHHDHSTGIHISSPNANANSNPIKGLILVNPATSFDESNWDLVAPALTTLGYLTEENNDGRRRKRLLDLPSAYSLLGGLTLSALIPSSEQFQTIVDTIMKMDSVSNPTRVIESIQGTLESFKVTADMLPPSLLEHRIKQWLMVGSSLVNTRLNQLEVPTLVVVGKEDRLIGSRQEVGRLNKVLPNSEKLEVPRAGHFVLDANVNLTEAIIYSNLLDPLNLKDTAKPYDPILDWKMPSQDVIDEVYESTVKRLEELFSPIYISTDKQGNRHMGLDHVPREGPIVFVSNHQLLGMDLIFLVGKLIQEGIIVRGLGHPIIFQQAITRGEVGGRIPGLKSTTIEAPMGPGSGNYQMFGAVMVSPRNYYRLMESGQNVLLFPGGVREVFHGRGEAYQIFWPEKVDFVRTAARFNATIVPISAVGMADSLNILLNASEVANLPLIGESAKAFAANVTAARFDSWDADYFVPPIVVPGLPSRNYFIFGTPMSTKQLDPRDRVECENTYKKLQDEMRRGFDDILDARERDPYKTAQPRLAYERFMGKKAPTFNIADLNKKRRAPIQR